MKYLLIAVATVAVLVVLVVVGMRLLLPPSLCDLVAVLDAAFDAGDDILAAVKDFLSAVSDDMVAGLDGNLRIAAEALVVAAKGVVALAFAPVEIVLNVVGPALDAADTACSIA